MQPLSSSYQERGREREREDVVHSSWPGKKEVLLLSSDHKSELVFIRRVSAVPSHKLWIVHHAELSLKLGRAAYTVKSPSPACIIFHALLKNCGHVNTFQGFAQNTLCKDAQTREKHL